MQKIKQMHSAIASSCDAWGQGELGDGVGGRGILLMQREAWWEFLCVHNVHDQKQRIVEI